MKKLCLSFLILLCCCLIGCDKNNVVSPGKYVDLELPSGTKWKSQNEPGLYSFNEANNFANGSIPTREQWNELIYNCEWSWTGSGYKVTSSNGKSIIISAEGYWRNGEIEKKNEWGSYWTSTLRESKTAAWIMEFSEEYSADTDNKKDLEDKCSVHLVKTNK